MKLAKDAILKFVFGMILVGALIFVPAGTLSYARGWLFMGVLFMPILLLGAVLLLRSPDTLKRRLDGREKEGTQKTVVAFSALLFLAGFLLAGLDQRFAWSKMPMGVSLAGAALFLGSYLLYAEVVRENAFLSRTVKVEAGQKLIDTGLYGIVRHPMYAATVLMFTVIPLILGSWAALPVFLLYPVLIVIRIRNEEKVLLRDLPGYASYQNRVRWRLLPFIW